MIILFLLALSLSTPAPSALLKNTSNLSTQFQEKCFGLVPTESVNRAALSSLLCGKNITDSSLKENLIKTSIIHIFVISGSHLILLDELLSLLRVPLFFRFLFLGCYSLATGWQPPAVRALLALIVKTYFRCWHWNFSSDQLVMITGLVSLALFPEWWNSFSLVMSWCAALAFSCVTLLRVRGKLMALVIAQLAVFLFMSAPLWGLGSLHPLGLLYNLTLAPLVAFLLLPLAFLTMMIHPLSVIFDGAFSLFSAVLQMAAEPIPSMSQNTPSLSFLWIWIFTWQVFIHFFRLHLHQGKDHPR
ncbi:MAG TPA: ComEC/Rec2 family competence protein [Bdellovibrio sp.]|nr:ComEC/Rec2 family competence protein [Bdellovibrio sp.]